VDWIHLAHNWRPLAGSSEDGNESGASVISVDLLE
jgi:hypothetical protein